MTSRELSDATEDKDGLEEAADIGQGVAKLGREFGRRIDEAEWLGNVQNAHIELANVISLVDSFFHRDLARRGYASPSFCWIWRTSASTDPGTSTNSRRMGR
ncbi:hypothetical protein [Comamonas aquatica]|jgi:hypothetical protein|uniref:hypothetical protein n=1 Tax=Comamonas aquatica TaxID=225991 RepID=UPI003CFE0C58